MRLFYCLLALGLLLVGGPAHAQPHTPADFGYHHLTMRYHGDTVHVLVLSKKGEELTRKPLLAGLKTQ